MNPALRERVVRFGRNNELAGILTTNRESPGTSVFLVIVNAGIIHRVGPNRLYVDLARRAAELSYPVLRFDLAGLGDSESASGGLSLTDMAQADMATAFEFLRKSHGATHFIAVGLCSGANYATLAAFAHEDVIGMVLIDPTVTRTRRSTMVHFTRRLLHLPTWGALLTLRHPVFRRSLGRVRSVAVARAAQGQSGQRAEQDNLPQPDEKISVALSRTLDRGVHMMLVFTGGVNHVYNYRQQLFDLLPDVDFRDQLRLEYMPETDHTICDGPSRTRMLSAMGEWLTLAFPAHRFLPTESVPGPATPEGAGTQPVGAPERIFVPENPDTTDFVI